MPCFGGGSGAGVRARFDSKNMWFPHNLEHPQIHQIKWILGIHPADPLNQLNPRMSSNLCENHMFLLSKRALTPHPPNPPKARHSSGRPWESLWEGLEELWDT